MCAADRRAGLGGGAARCAPPTGVRQPVLRPRIARLHLSLVANQPAVLVSGRDHQLRPARLDPPTGTHLLGPARRDPPAGTRPPGPTLMEIQASITNGPARTASQGDSRHLTRVSNRIGPRELVGRRGILSAARLDRPGRAGVQAVARGDPRPRASDAAWHRTGLARRGIIGGCPFTETKPLCCEPRNWVRPTASSRF